MKKATKLKRKTKKTLTGIELLTSPGYRSIFKSMAETYTKCPLIFKMINSAGSFTTVDEKKNMIMNIDLKQFEDASFDTSHYHVIAKALIIHESGHVIYSDFDVIKKNVDNIKGIKEKIQEIINTYYKETDETKKEAIADELYNHIYDYVYACNLPKALNSFEDASIERSMSELGKDANGSLVFLNDIVYSKELNVKKTTEIPTESDKWNDITFMFALMEARHLAKIGYRKDTDISILKECFEKHEIEKIQELATYARFVAPTTEERNVVACVFLDMCKPILENIAKELTHNYLTNISEAESMMKSMEEDAEKYSSSSSGSGDLSSVGGSGLPGGSKMSEPKKTSSYDLPMPDDLKEKMKEKRKELSKEKSEESSEASSEGKSETEEKGGRDGSSREGSGEGKADDKKPYSKETLSDDAMTDMLEALDKASKTFKKNEERAESDKIEGGDIRAGEGASHHGTEVEMIDYNEFLDDDITSAGKSALEEIEKKELKVYVNTLVKKMKKVLMRKQMDSVSRGKYEGDLDVSNIYRISTDLGVFKKETIGDKSRVRFAILVDESGSMGEQKMQQAIIGCWMIASAAQKLKIPFCVYGHDESFYGGCNFRLRKYIDFKESHKKPVIKRLFTMEAHDNNRDGLAIFHTCRELVRNSKPKEELYFIIISDGQPAAIDYGGSEAITDMQQTMNTFKKLYNVHSIGIGLGNFDFSRIRQIYENSVCVKNPNELPDEMFKIFKRIVKCK